MLCPSSFLILILEHHIHQHYLKVPQLIHHTRQTLPSLQHTYTSNPTQHPTCVSAPKTKKSTGGATSTTTKAGPLGKSFH